jgi:hypothetical protein
MIVSTLTIQQIGKVAQSQGCFGMSQEEAEAAFKQSCSASILPAIG